MTTVFAGMQRIDTVRAEVDPGEDMARTELELEKCRPFPSGIVLLIHRVVRP
jgi:hypothetical protein